MRRTLPLCESLEERSVLSTTPELLIELGFGSQSIHSITQFGSETFFVATTRESGEELWRVDSSSPNGASLVKDINPGNLSSSPSNLVNLNGTLFFVASDGANGRELWKSDGTETGTLLVKDIHPGSFGSYIYSSNPNQLTIVGNVLYFAGYDGLEGLWKSDGTEAGTILVRRLRDLQGLTTVNGLLYFVAEDGFGQELWTSDGSEAGTVMVKDINAAKYSSFDFFYSAEPRSLTNVNGQLFFTANDGTNGRELWKSDGTEAGTYLVKDTTPGNHPDFGWPYSSEPSNLTNVGGTLFYVSFEQSTGTGLWKSDGTADGTVLVANSFLGDSTYPANLTNIRGTLYFTAATGSTGRELWKSDGTEAGTLLVKDIRAGANGSNPKDLMEFDGKVFFNAFDDATGLELWMSDGTEGGTALVKDLGPGTFGSYASSLTNVGGTLFFSACAGLQVQLWQTDGSESNAVPVTSHRFIGTTSSDPSNFTAVGALTFFVATTPLGGRELWKTDGTAAGTILVKDIHPGAGAYNYPKALTNVGGTLFFAADDGLHGRELWRSDGTEAGTVMVKDIQPGPSGSFDPYASLSLSNIAGVLYFAANDGVSGTELWKSDGTDVGTVLVSDVEPGVNGSDPKLFTNVSGNLYFRATNGLTGPELWKSDGTQVGTVLVKDIQPGRVGSLGSFFAGNLTNVGGLLYFTAFNSSTGIELWKSDGTELGTVLLKDIRAGRNGSNPSSLTDVGGTIFFTADDGSTGRELWKSDGTANGTILVKDIGAGVNTSLLGNLTNVDGTIFFSASADTAVNNFELWKSDGTAAGTVPVSETESGRSLGPSFLTNVDGTLYFAAIDRLGSAGELWKSDGSKAGTELVRDIRPGPIGSIAYFGLNNVNGTLYFVADDGITGNEPWVVRPPTLKLKISQPAARLDEGSLSGPLTNYLTSVTDSSVGGGSFRITLTVPEGMGVFQQISQGPLLSPVGPKGVGTNQLILEGSLNPSQLLGDLALFQLRILDIDPAAYPTAPVPVSVLVADVNDLDRTASNVLNFIGVDLAPTIAALATVNGAVISAPIPEGTNVDLALGPYADAAGIGNDPLVGAIVYWGDSTSTTLSPAQLTILNTGASLKLSHLYVDEADMIDNQIRVSLLSAGKQDEINTSVPKEYANAGTRQPLVIRDVAPTVMAANSLTTNVSSPASLSGSFVDPGVKDGPWTASFRFKDNLNNTLTTQTVTLSSQGTFNNVKVQHPYRSAGTYKVDVTIKDKDGVESNVLTFDLLVASVVSGRGMFYNGSAFGAEIDTSKQALLPGNTSSFSNYTGSIQGITGLAVKIDGGTQSLTTSDFEFHTWKGVGAPAWQPLAAVATVNPVPGPNGFEITFADGSVVDTWLRVTVRATARTRLATPDVFYFGSARADVGEGNTPTDVRVNAIDVALIRGNQSPLPNSVDITNIYDVNKDGRVNGLDFALARGLQNNLIIRQISV